MPINLKDVAREVNLSINTVSRALRGLQGVSEARRQQIREVAERIGYRPNRAARRLVLQRSQSIGILVPSLNIPFFAEIDIAIQEMLQEKSYFLYTLNTRDDPAHTMECIELLVEHRIEGLLSIGLPPPQSAELLRSHNIPVVVMVMFQGDLPPHFVGYDDEAGGYQAARHLIGLGHTRIAYFTGKWESDHASLRRAGFSRAVDETMGRVVSRVVFDNYDNTIRSGYQSAGGIVDMIRKGEVSAVMCVCDAVAFGLMHMLNEQELRIPEDVSVIGYDNIEMAEFSIPPLTTISQDASRIGRFGSNLMLQMLESGEDWSKVRHQVLLEPSLVARQSTARLGKSGESAARRHRAKAESNPAV